MLGKRVLAFWVLAGGLFGSAWMADDGATTIRGKALKQHVVHLASDELAGREAGKPGIRQTEEYVAAAFSRFGLKPLPGESGFFLSFPLFTRDFDADSTELTIATSAGTARGAAGVDFRPFDFSDDGTAEAEVVFAGYGITAPEYGHDDYDGLDVRGRIVLVLRHEPGETDPNSSFDGTTHTRHAEFAAKAELARENGAAGMILVTDPLHHPDADDLRVGRRLLLSPADATSGQRRDGAAAEPRLVAVHMARGLARQLVQPTGVTLEELQRAVDEGRRPAAFDLSGARVRIAVRRADDSAEVPARNVAGFVEGSDPRLKHEWIVIGAHHDHVGGFRGEGDTVFNGADDNASGTAAVLELARSFAAAAEPPPRSLVFVTFTAEEKGLLGSRALVEQELIPMDRVVFMLNLDMIGRNPREPLQVFGDGYARQLREIVNRSNRDVGLRLDFAGTDYAGNSDHHAFYRRDIPFLFFFSGVHEDYHRPGDHAEKLDYARMQRIVRLGHNVISRVAGAERSPDFVHHIAWLGLRAELLHRSSGRVVQVTAVDAGSRAEQSGLREGDVLLAFDEVALEAGTVGRSFREVKPGTRVVLSVQRGSDELALELARARTGFMGIGPATVGEDDRRRLGLHANEGVFVRNVVPDGPSDQAGMHAGDVMIRLSGLPVSPRNLRSRLAQIGAGETVDVLVLRDGERVELSVTLAERPS